MSVDTEVETRHVAYAVPAGGPSVGAESHATWMEDQKQGLVAPAPAAAAGPPPRPAPMSYPPTSTAAPAAAGASGPVALPGPVPVPAPVHTDQHYRQQWGNQSTIATRVQKGLATPTRWPVRPVTHHDPLAFSIQFDLPYNTLNDVLAAGAGENPLFLELDAVRVARAFKRPTDLPGYDFAPYSIDVVQICNTGVPCGWFAQLQTDVPNDVPRQWLTDNIVTTAKGGSDPSARARVQAAYHILPGAHAQSMKDRVFECDTDHLSHPVWGRWASQSRAEVDDFLQQHKDPNGAPYYKFRVSDVRRPQADGPVVHAILEHMPQIVAGARMGLTYSTWSAAQAVQTYPDHSAILTVPVGPVTKLVNDLFAQCDHPQTVMQFQGVKLRLTPDRGYAFIKQHQDARKVGVEYVRNAQVYVSVTLRLTGVFVDPQPWSS